MSILKFKSVYEAATDLLLHLETLNSDRKDLVVGIQGNRLVVNGDTEFYCPSIYDGYQVQKIVANITQISKSAKVIPEVVPFENLPIHLQEIIKSKT